MNKVNKLTIKILILVSILVLPMCLISADNLTMNETGLLNETEKEGAICEEQLELAVEEYNRLLEDYRDGMNCGTSTVFLKNMNDILAEERNICMEEIGKIKVFRVGFYIFLGILTLISMLLIFNSVRKK